MWKIAILPDVLIRLMLLGEGIMCFDTPKLLTALQSEDMGRALTLRDEVLAVPKSMKTSLKKPIMYPMIIDG